MTKTTDHAGDRPGRRASTRHVSPRVSTRWRRLHLGVSGIVGGAATVTAIAIGLGGPALSPVTVAAPSSTAAATTTGAATTTTVDPAASQGGDSVAIEDGDARIDRVGNRTRDGGNGRGGHGSHS